MEAGRESGRNGGTKKIPNKNDGGKFSDGVKWGHSAVWG